MDSKIDRRKNAEPYKKGEKPSPRSEYFGKSYGQLQRESKSSPARTKALEKKVGQFLSDIRKHGDNQNHGKNKISGRNGYHGMDYAPNKTRIVKD